MKANQALGGSQIEEIKLECKGMISHTSSRKGSEFTNIMTMGNVISMARLQQEQVQNGEQVSCWSLWVSLVVVVKARWVISQQCNVSSTHGIKVSTRMYSASRIARIRFKILAYNQTDTDFQVQHGEIL